MDMQEVGPGAVPERPGTGSERADANTKTFTVGTATQHLPLPGNRSVTKVLVDGVEIPETVQETHRADDGSLYPVLARHWKRQTDEAGTPHLSRGPGSNHGFWQKGSTVSVSGKWGADDAKAAPKAKAAKKDAAPASEGDGEGDGEKAEGGGAGEAGG